MNLNLAWSTPSPTPDCGFKAQYRRKGDPSYTEIATSGTTLTIPIVAPANYEGRILSDCCEMQSSGTPFGVNSYVAVSVAAATDDASKLILTISSDFGNPYDTIIAGTITLLNLPQVPFSVTYDAYNTTQDFDLGTVNYPPDTPAVSVAVSAVSAIFNNGGELQQFDAVNTPPYFKLYWDGDVSGTTWVGSPMSLPSFTLDSFSPSELAPDGVTVMAGQLNMSYILDSVYPNSFTSMLIQVYDPLVVDPIGTLVIAKSPIGVRTATITLTAATSPLTTATEFRMTATWPDLTVMDSKRFYLPS